MLGFSALAEALRAALVRMTTLPALPIRASTRLEPKLKVPTAPQGRLINLPSGDCVIWFTGTAISSNAIEEVAGAATVSFNGFLGAIMNRLSKTVNQPYR